MSVFYRECIGRQVSTRDRVWENHRAPNVFLDVYNNGQCPVCGNALTTKLWEVKNGKD